MIRRFAYGALALLLLPSGGCFFSSDSDDDNVVREPTPNPTPTPNPGRSEAALEVSWNLMPNVCPGSTVRVVAVNSANVDTVDLFDCSAGIGRTDPLPLGDYTVYVEIIDAPEVADTLYAQSFSEVVSLNSPGEVVAVPFDILTSEAYLAATWTLLDAATQQPIDCANAGADAVSILATLVGPSGTGIDDIFDCEAREGITSPLPLGDYEVVVSVLEDRGNREEVLGQSMPRQAILNVGNELVDLGNFQFEFQ